eukprot:751348-Hanusia_phi.AAC.2
MSRSSASLLNLSRVGDLPMPARLRELKLVLHSKAHAGSQGRKEETTCDAAAAGEGSTEAGRGKATPLLQASSCFRQCGIAGGCHAA